MGRKKKKIQKPWCWYCNREFDDEKILIQHQKAKHFKCHLCHKKLFTGPGLAIHCMQVHKETIDKIPSALPGRDSLDLEVYGMEGIPADAIQGKVVDDEPASKSARMSVPMPPMGYSGMIPGMMTPSGYPMMSGYPGMMPMMPPAGMPPMPPNPQPAYDTSNIAPAYTPKPEPTEATSAAATFPAYSGAKVESSTTVKAPELATVAKSATGAVTKIVHPDEDISLEERRAKMAKYQLQIGSSRQSVSRNSAYKGYGVGSQGIPTSAMGQSMPHYGMMPMTGRPY